MSLWLWKFPFTFIACCYCILYHVSVHNFKQTNIVPWNYIHNVWDLSRIGTINILLFLCHIWLMEGDPLKHCVEADFEVWTKNTGQEHGELFSCLCECSRYRDNHDVGYHPASTVLATCLVSVTKHPAKSNYRKEVFILANRGLGVEVHHG